MRKFVVAAIAMGAMWVAPSAQAAIPEAFGEGPGDGIACTLQGDNDRICGSTAPRSTAETFDGLPIDVNVAFPADDAVGDDGDYPLIMIFHGYGGSKLGFGTFERFLDRGYAVFSMTDRGFHQSCGTSNARDDALLDTLPGDCTDGYVRLLDTRYEVRDAQHLAGRLADEGLIAPQQIGAVGGSYGGGMSMSLAALKNRTMLPDGSLVPWTSPVDGLAMEMAAATPNIPWTDLAYSLAPNGGTLDYEGDAGYRGRFGVAKQSLVEGLYISGAAAGQYAAPGADPDADLGGWRTRLTAGEPYDGDAFIADMLDELTTHHSSFYIDDSIPPAPMLISSGFTDDLFPADEALRFYHRTRDTHPGTPISVFFGNFGHQRAQNRAADATLLNSREDAWLDFYVKGVGPTPFQGAEAQTQVCPAASPSGGPFSAANWAKLTPGEVRLTEAAAKTITPGSGATSIGVTHDPVSSGANPCKTSPAADQAGVATYRLPAATTPYTMIGAATVVADINSPTANSQLAARLFDVAPDGTQTLINRGVFRPAVGSSRQVFQLHPNGWRFAQGHIPKLELLPRDSGTTVLNTYARQSDGQGAITVSNLQLRLPVLEKPGAQNGFIKAMTAKVVPQGDTLAGDFAALPIENASLRKGKLKLGKNGAKLSVPASWEAGHVTVEVLAGGKGKKKGKGRSSAKKKGKKGKRVVLAKGKATIAGGQDGAAKLRLTKKGRAKLEGKKRAKVRVEVTTLEQEGVVKSKRTLVLG